MGRYRQKEAQPPLEVKGKWWAMGGQGLEKADKRSTNEGRRLVTTNKRRAKGRYSERSGLWEAAETKRGRRPHGHLPLNTVPFKTALLNAVRQNPASHQET